MIKIGFEDEIKPYDDDEEFEEKQVRSGQRLMPEERREVYISPKKMEELKQAYSCVVVHDYGDEYHLSEAERQAKNKYYETFKVLRKAKNKYRRIDEFVTVTRNALKCLDAVAETNGMYDPEEFKKLYFRGKIFINGLKFPKYKGRDKKNISWDYLSEFICSDADPKDLLPKQDEVKSVDELEECKKAMFTDEEYQQIMTPTSETEEIKNDQFFDENEDVQFDRNIAVYVDKSDTKKLGKEHPEFLYAVREIKRNMKSDEHLNSYAYDLMMDDIEAIQRYDQERGYIRDNAEMPEFKGDMSSNKDYRKYIQKLQEYEDENIKQSYNGRMKSQEEIRELEMKAMLEENGWNIRALYHNKEKEERLKKAFKADKKKEKALKAKLIAIQDRNKRRRMGEIDEDEVSSKSKKKKKKKGKKNSVEQYKDNAKKSTNEFLMSTVDHDGDFDDYKQNSLDWSWDNIKK